MFVILLTKSNESALILNYPDRVRLREKRSRRFRGDELICEMEGEISEFSVFEFREVIKATDNFSEENKLGEGGFGPVYKVNKTHVEYNLSLSD